MTTGAAELPPGQAVGTETSRRRAFLFGKRARIASRLRFEALWGGAAKRVGRYVVAWSDASETAESRLGVVASKRTFRHAVDRNRARRLVRESFRHLRPEFSGGPYDLLVVAKRRIGGAAEPEVRADLRRLCAGFGMLPPAAAGAASGRARP